MTDYLMTNEEFLKKGLIPAGQPGFGWYRVKVGWITPQDQIEPKEGKKGTYVNFSVALNTQERAIFVPDPERDDSAVFQSSEPMYGRSFFVNFFLGGQQMKNALRGMQRRFETDGQGPTAADIHRAFSEGECWVKIFHGENFRGEPEEVVAKWYSSAPERTFVHETEREAFLQRGE